MQKLYHDGTTFLYDVAGPPGDRLSTPPIVLLHGFPLNHRIWADVAARLAKRHRVIRPNFRGFGTLTNDEPFTIESLAADIRALLTQTGDLPCVMAGLSMGGYVALSYARQWPEDLKGLALVDTRAEADSPEAKEKREATIRLVHEKGVPAVAEALLPNLLAPETSERIPAASETLMRIMLDTPRPTIEHASCAMRDRRDSRDLLPKLKMPVDVIVGEHDTLSPPSLSSEMAEAIPDATLSIIPHAGHMTPLENPDAVAEAIEDLVSRAM